MKKRILKAAFVGVAASLLGASSLIAGDRGHGDDDRGRDNARRFWVRTTLSGYQEVPAVSTTGHGTFRAFIDTVGGTITWRLTYDALEAPVTQSHVHFGQMSVNGGISFFLCSNLANGPAGTQACPATGPAELTGVITPDLVIGPNGQGIQPMSLEEIIAAIRAGHAYANVHSATWPAGEIRGQIR